MRRAILLIAVFLSSIIVCNALCGCTGAFDANWPWRDRLNKASVEELPDPGPIDECLVKKLKALQELLGELCEVQPMPQDPAAVTVPVRVKVEASAAEGEEKAPSPFPPPEPIAAADADCDGGD